MLVIRLVRFGRKKQVFFRLVVAEKDRAVKKKPIEQVGSYNPHEEGGKGKFIFNKEVILKYLKNGAQPSQTVARLLVKEGLKEAGKFVKKRATKPKKEAPKKEEEKVEESKEGEKTEDVKEETKVEEKVEESKTEDVKEETKVEEKVEESKTEDVKEETKVEEKVEETKVEEKVEESKTEDVKKEESTK